MSDVPTIGERYARATRSGNLKVRVERGDVDILIAAGLVRDTLATRLIRLRSEYDAVRRGGLTISCATAPGLPRVLIPTLKGFAQAREALVDLALAEAAMRHIQPEDAREIAMATLDLFLDPLCARCDGRGYTGGYGLPTIRCQACRESGRRQAWFRTDILDSFAKWVGANIESKVDRALERMQHLLRRNARQS